VNPAQRLQRYRVQADATDPSRRGVQHTGRHLLLIIQGIQGVPEEAEAQQRMRNAEMRNAERCERGMWNAGWCFAYRA